MRVVVAEVVDRRQVRGMGVVLIEEPMPPVVQCEQRVSDRPVSGPGKRFYQHPQPVQLNRLAAAHCHEPAKTQLGQRPPQLISRIVRQQHGRALVHRAQCVRVEVVAVQMRHVQVIGLPVGVPIQRRVVREREPGREVGGTAPGVAQHTPCVRFHI